MSTRGRILIIDDGLDYAHAVAEHLDDYDLVLPTKDPLQPCLGDGPTAIAFLDKHADKVDVILLDMHFDVPQERLFELAAGASLRRTKRFQGIAILRQIRQRHPDLPVVLLTALEDLSLIDADGELASQSMTYVLGNEDLDTLRIRINAAMMERAQSVEDEHILWGADNSMRALRRRLGVLAKGSRPLILEGETGTGKSYLAERFVHAYSGRKGPFVAVDLSTIPRDLVPAYLFGALKGSFTGAIVDRKGVFELAQHGTLFIDEIQNIPHEVQKQLLVVLQERRVRPLGSATEHEVDVKVIAATNSTLVDAVSRGEFRQDLYMRLGPASRVKIPPLRTHPKDLLFFCQRLTTAAARHPDNDGLRAELAKALGLPPDSALRLELGRKQSATSQANTDLLLALPRPTWQRLERHPWPGNMRELSMVLHNIVSFTLLAAVEAIRAGLRVQSSRLQVDPGLVGELLAASSINAQSTSTQNEDDVAIRIHSADSLNKVAIDVERQYLSTLFERNKGDFGALAQQLLGDSERARAIQLRMNQIGLKVRKLRQQ